MLIWCPIYTAQCGQLYWLLIQVFFHFYYSILTQRFTRCLASVVEDQEGICKDKRLFVTHFLYEFWCNSHILPFFNDIHNHTECANISTRVGWHYSKKYIYVCRCQVRNEYNLTRWTATIGNWSIVLKLSLTRIIRKRISKNIRNLVYCALQM